jgi:ferritin
VITESMREELNAQINAEFYSAYLYLAMSSWCDTQNLKGFAHWLNIQYQEETLHTLKFMQHLQDRGGLVELRAIAAPPAKFDSALQLFERILDHERSITERIHKIYEKALAEKDYTTQVFLHWFVTEQVEEEANVDHVLEKIRMIGERSSGLLYLDKELGKRAG